MTDFCFLDFFFLSRMLCFVLINSVLLNYFYVLGSLVQIKTLTSFAPDMRPWSATSSSCWSQQSSNRNVKLKMRWKPSRSSVKAFTLNNGYISPENDCVSGHCSLAAVDSEGRWVCWFYQRYHCHDDCSPGCVTNKLRDIGLQSLQNRRKQQRLTFVFKMVRGLTPETPANEFLTPISFKRLIEPRNPTVSK